MRFWLLSIALILIFPICLLSQNSHGAMNQHDAKYGQERHFRIAAFMGHTVLPTGVSGEDFYIPSWGLDLEY